jgi:hypothetical protein
MQKELALSTTLYFLSATARDDMIPAEEKP